jgi:hypothetical protein
MSGSFLTGLPREANQGGKEGDFAKSLNYCSEAALGGLRGIFSSLSLRATNPAYVRGYRWKKHLQYVGPDPRSAMLSRSGNGPYIFRPWVVLFLRRRPQGRRGNLRSGVFSFCNSLS